MRSGSTLLKALLGVAPDVSHLPEVNFQRYANKEPQQLGAFSPKKVVVLKKPCWFTEVRRYPQLPDAPGFKKIILARDVYDTVYSLKRMLLGPFVNLFGSLLNRCLVERYWCQVYENVLKRLPDAGHVMIVKYEDLVFNPVETTERLFAFIGSERTTGVDRYEKPQNYTWKWFRDDASPKIKSLQVLPPNKTDLDFKLLNVINQSKRAQRVRWRLGFRETPPEG